MNSRALVRQQLDARLQGFPRVEPPRGGWIRTIRQALGMTMAQLGARLQVTAPGVAEMENRDEREAISVAKLREVADALGCDLVITFAPRIPLEEMVRQQAIMKAREERERLLHTMALEDQTAGAVDAVNLESAVAEWMAKRASRLWD